MKSVYIIQPYMVGSKNSKSLAIIIPSEIKKKFDIDISTPFVVYPDSKSKKVTVQNINGITNTKKVKNMMIPAEDLYAPRQQASARVQ